MQVCKSRAAIYQWSLKNMYSKQNNLNTFCMVDDHDGQGIQEGECKPPNLPTERSTDLCEPTSDSCTGKFEKNAQTLAGWLSANP